MSNSRDQTHSSPPPMGSQAAGDPDVGSAYATNIAVPKQRSTYIVHVPYPDQSSGAKDNSNRIHKEGYVRKVACMNCLVSIASFSENKVVGRGVSNFNEVFCCMGHETLGVGGSICGRCVGLGVKAGDYMKIPSTCSDVAADLIKLLPSYNKIMKKTWAAPNTIQNPATFASLSDAEKKYIRRVVAAAQKVKSRYEGLQLKDNSVAKTPSKRGEKRSHDSFALGGESIFNNLTTIDTSTQGVGKKLDRVEVALSNINRTITRLGQIVDRQSRLLKQGRERQRYLVRHIRTLHKAVKKDTDLTIPAFDMNEVEYESEGDGQVTGADDDFLEIN